MQLLRAITGPAAQIDNARRILQCDLRHQILRRTCALAGELEIKIGIPLGHALKTLPLMTLMTQICADYEKIKKDQCDQCSSVSSVVRFPRPKLLSSSPRRSRPAC